MNQSSPMSCCLPALDRHQQGGDAMSAQDASPGTVGGSARRTVLLSGGTVTVGTVRPVLREDGEGPPRRIAIRPFRIDACAVTNRSFADFVAATGFRTDAERFGCSFVFHLLAPPDRGTACVPEAPWWRHVEDASWSQPDGPGSSVADRLDHPAVHVS